jgi:copper chaperone NosL
VSDRRFASQIVAPLEEPKFFDDLGCLGNYLNGAGTLPARTVVYVTDHSTRQWVRADEAVFTRVDTLSAPMGSHVVAHASAETRAADPAARGGTPIGSREVFPAGLPGGPR